MIGITFLSVNIDTTDYIKASLLKFRFIYSNRTINSNIVLKYSVLYFNDQKEIFDIALERKTKI